MAGWRKQNNIIRTAFTASDANPALNRATFKAKNRLILTQVIWFNNGVFDVNFWC